MPSRDFYTPAGAVPNDIDSRQDLKSTWCCFDKGYTPPPFKLVQDESSGLVTVQFELNQFVSTCKCRIVCTSSALVFQDPTQGSVGQFCPADEQFSVTLIDQVFTEDSPSVFNFVFEDAQGNQTSVDVNSLVTVVPKQPLALTKAYGDLYVNEVAIPLYSAAFVDLRNAVDQYQVERYEGSPNNRAIWTDWTHTRGLGNKERVHWDRRVRPGVEYGYRVRFRSSFDDASPWSTWTTLEA